MSLQTHSDQGKFLSLSTNHLTKEAGDALTLLASGRHTSEYVFVLEMGFIVRLHSHLLTQCLDDFDPYLKNLLETIAAEGFKIVDFDVDAEESPHLPRGDGAPLDPAVYAKLVTICPNCRSRDIESKSDIQSDGNTSTQGVECLDCGSTWVEIYNLSGYENLEVPNKAEVQS